MEARCAPNVRSSPQVSSQRIHRPVDSLLWPSWLALCHWSSEAHFWFRKQESPSDWARSLLQSALWKEWRLLKALVQSMTTSSLCRKGCFALWWSRAAWCNWSRPCCTLLSASSLASLWSGGVILSLWESSCCTLIVRLWGKGSFVHLPWEL